MAKPRKKKLPRASEGTLSIRKLVAKITRENRYAEIQTGADRGKERVVW